MSKEIEILKAAGYEDIKLVATYEADDLDFKNMYIAKFGDLYRHVHIDKHSNTPSSTGSAYNSLKKAMSDSYQYLTVHGEGGWDFKDNEITEEVKKANQISLLGIEITSEEIGAIKYARDIFAGENQSEMAEIHSFYLSRLLKKLESI